MVEVESIKEKSCYNCKYSTIEYENICCELCFMEEHQCLNFDQWELRDTDND